MYSEVHDVVSGELLECLWRGEGGPSRVGQTFSLSVSGAVYNIESGELACYRPTGSACPAWRCFSVASRPLDGAIDRSLLETSTSVLATPSNSEN